MKKQNIVESISTLVMIMFLYAAFSKYFDWSTFKESMFNQPFQNWFVWVLIIVIPPIEIVIAGMLLFSKTRYKGLILSSIIMAAFTVYIGVALIGIFPKMPCSCGGIIRALGWKKHFFFNLFFLAISIIGARIQHGLNHTKNEYHPVSL